MDAKIIRIGPKRLEDKPKKTERARPKIFYIQENLREFILNEYPILKPYVSPYVDERLTVFIIGEADHSYVTDYGFMVINPETLDRLLPVLTRFFKLLETGVSPKIVLNSFVNYLTGESYGRVNCEG